MVCSLQESSLSLSSPGLMKEIANPYTPIRVSSYIIETKLVKLFLKGLSTEMYNKNCIRINFYYTYYTSEGELNDHRPSSVLSDDCLEESIYCYFSHV